MRDARAPERKRFSAGRRIVLRPVDRCRANGARGVLLRLPPRGRAPALPARHRRRMAMALRHPVAWRAQAYPDSMRPRSRSCAACARRAHKPPRRRNPRIGGACACRVSRDGPSRLARPRVARRAGELVRVRGSRACCDRARHVLSGEGAARPTPPDCRRGAVPCPSRTGAPQDGEQSSRRGGGAFGCTAFGSASRPARP